MVIFTNFIQMNTTILYPGAFKPLSGAHIYIINKYLQQPNVKNLVLFISPEKRGDIESNVAFNIAKNVLTDKRIEIILDKNSYSPILAIYRWIEKLDREPGNYVLASSTKGDDYKRVKEFTKNYSMERFGKNLPTGVNIIELPIDVEPLKYQIGERKGTPISSSNIREDLKNNNFDKFKENYPFCDIEIVNYIWNNLNKNK